MKIVNLSKSYGANTVLKNLSLDVERGQITCILGESGGGKTTLLNAVAGLIDYEGQIIAEDECEKKPAYVFQEPRLLPNLTVEKNLALVEKDLGKISAVLKTMKLSDKASAYPYRLSGGEKQRVALARAMLYNSGFFLLDEPFSSLDIKLKLALAQELFSLWQERGFTALLVTHSVDEAVALSHKIAVLSGGKITEEFTSVPECGLFASSPLKQRLYEALLK